MLALKLIIDMARRKNITVRLVISPYLPQYGRQLSNLSTWIKGVQTMATDISVWDYSMAVETTSAFADRLHLNYDGSLLLLKRLNQDGSSNPNISLVVPTRNRGDLLRTCLLSLTSQDLIHSMKSFMR
jgi:hypothetical protein